MSRFPFALLVLLSACGTSSETPPPPAEAAGVLPDTAYLSEQTVKIAGFTLATATSAPWRDLVTAPARVALDPSATEPIGSIVEGRITKVYVMPGDRVARGQVLVAIHSHEMMDARAELGRAKAELASAQSHQRVATSAAARAERLFALKALSAADLERARGDREAADANVESATAMLTRGDALVEHLVGTGALPPGYDEHWVLIRAPIAGQVVNRHIEPGNVVLVGAPLVTVSRTSSLVLIAQLPDAAASALRPGATVSFVTSATGSQSFAARVTRIFPSVDTLTRTIEVHAAIVDRQASQLRAEMFATAELSGGASSPAVTVPLSALQPFDGDTAVIVAQPRDGGLFLEVRAVRVGRRSRDRAEVLSGVEAGVQVVEGGAAVARAELLKRRGGGEAGH